MNYIVINTYYFDNLSVEDQISVLTHDFGHAMGLSDVNSTEGFYSILIPVVSEITTITICDTIILEENLIKYKKER